MRHRLLSIALAGLLTASPALSCAFHGYAPKSTMVEKLLNSDHIILARPDAGNPFRYAPAEALEGGTDYVDIPDLVDSTTRRRLARSPDDHVLFARDGAYGPWQRLAYIDAGTEQVLRDIMERLPAWALGDSQDRYEFFASLLSHPDRDIHALALRELDLASYSALRALPLQIDAKRLKEPLNFLTEADLKPIRILLLGFSAPAADKAFFSSGVKAHASSTGPLLGAYATAMLEHGGPDAARELISRHLQNRALPPDSRELLAEALAIHSAAGTAETRATIRTAVSRALADDPDLAPHVARQFGSRSDWSQRDAVSAAMKSGAAGANLLLLAQYVAFANEQAAQNGN